MEYIEFTVPPGVIVQAVVIPSPIPGMHQNTNLYRLMYDENQGVEVRDMLGRMTNEATKKALATIEAKQKLVQVQEEQKKKQITPNLTVKRSLEEEKQKLESVEPFVPMNPKIEVPPEMTGEVTSEPVVGETVILQKGEGSAKVKLASGRIVNCYMVKEGLKVQPETGDPQLSTEEWAQFATVSSKL